jgi:hypothetical protein
MQNNKKIIGIISLGLCVGLLGCGNVEKESEEVTTEVSTSNIETGSSIENTEPSEESTSEASDAVVEVEEEYIDVVPNEEDTSEDSYYSWVKENQQRTETEVLTPDATGALDAQIVIPSELQEKYSLYADSDDGYISEYILFANINGKEYPISIENEASRVRELNTDRKTTPAREFSSSEVLGYEIEALDNITIMKYHLKDTDWTETSTTPEEYYLYEIQPSINYINKDLDMNEPWGRQYFYPMSLIYCADDIDIHEFEDIAKLITINVESHNNKEFTDEEYLTFCKEQGAEIIAE